MKRFGNIWIAVLVMASMLVTSCEAYDSMLSSDEIVYNGFGEITLLDASGYFEITRDDGVLLRAVEYGGSKEVSMGERVYFKYNILPGNGDYVSEYSSEEQTVYDVRIIVFNNIHCVPILRKSFVGAGGDARADSIGNDLVRVVSAAFSGNYINIGFEYFRYENGDEHMINLVWDDTRSETDSVYIELRHNAMGETDASRLMSATGLASFRIADLMPDGAEEIDVKLIANMDRVDGVGEYIERETCYTGTYSLYTRVYITGSDMFTPVGDNTFASH